MSNSFEKLKTLLTRLIDSRDGYREAISHVESPFLREILTEFADWRDREVAELRGYLEQKDGHIDTDGSLLAAAHRIFLDLKDRVSNTDDKAALEEIVRGEEKLADDFDAAIAAADGRDPEYSFLLKEHTAVRDQIDRLKTRRDLAA